MKINIEVETLEEYKKIISTNDEEIIKLLKEIKLETENIKEYFNTKSGNIITKGMIEYIENQDKDLKLNSNDYINKLANAIDEYKKTYKDISKSVGE